LPGARFGQGCSHHRRRPWRYFEALAPNGTPIMNGPGNAGSDVSRDRIGTPYGQKSMNTHIHLLEAFTVLYRVWPDRILRDRLIELAFLIRDRLPRTPGYLPLYYTSDWKPLPGSVSYGHDVETVYLLAETAEVLGLPNDPTTLDLAKRVWNNTLAHGYDTEHGGFFLEGAPGQPAHDRKKVWWVQAEALNSLLMMLEHASTTDQRYWHAWLASWRFTREHQIDQARGGWYDEVSADGTNVLKSQKSNDWKDPYHTVRALLNMSEALRTLPPR
jgi:mannobiose 2-epimerase